MERPIQDWHTRAIMLSSIALPACIENTTGRLVDAITIDDNVDPALQEYPNHNLIDVVRVLDPDVWQVNFESTRLLAFIAGGNLGGHTRVFQANVTSYFDDERSGMPLSTTLFVDRIRGHTPVKDI